MKKISKIIICCIMAVSVIVLMCFSTFATYGNNSGYYGKVTYTPLSNTTSNLPQLTMPIVVDSSFPTFGNYVGGSNRRFQTFNTVGSYASIRLILPNSGSEYYVSSAYNVKIDYMFEYNSNYLTNFINSSPDGVIFTLPKVTTAGGTEITNLAGSVSIEVFIKPNGVDKVETYKYSFVLSSSMTIKASDIPILEELTNNSTIGFLIKWSTKNSNEYRAPDLTIKLPLDFKPLSIDFNELNYNQGYEEGAVEGYEQGTIDGYEQGKEEWKAKYDSAKEGLDNSNAVLNFFQGILEAVQGTLNTFFDLEVFGFQLGNIVAILLSALVVIVVIKLIL